MGGSGLILYNLKIGPYFGWGCIKSQRSNKKNISQILVDQLNLKNYIIKVNTYIFFLKNIENKNK